MDARGAWYLVGPAMGLVVVGLLWMANRPLGALGGWVDFSAWVRRPSEKAGWRLFFLAGIVGGGLLHALLSGGPRPTFAYVGLTEQLSSPLVLGLAGGLMGYGARTAGGCTSGHGICGTALGSPASFVATMTFMVTAIAVANVVTRLLLGGAS
jgi:uncharacterized protein